MRSSHAAAYRTKAVVEAAHPDFPSIVPLSAPLDQYAATVYTILREANIPLSPFSVTWRDLTVSAPKSSKLPRAAILRSASGYLRPGQICLVLGASGAGSSTLLSALAARPFPRGIKVEGEVLFGGEDAGEDNVVTQHMTYVVPQQDIHLPELTVRQTLHFAAECRWPDFLPFAEELRRNDIDIVANVLKISRVLDTVVGSNTLRGVSGGERKRVTIGEMAIGMVQGTLIMDNWSKGLDAATTLSITKSMRDFAHQTKGSAIVSMQAPGTDVFNLFDTLCVLHEGQTIFFGPPAEAESYFNSLGFVRPPNRSIPDFVATVTQPELRHEYLSVPPDQRDDKDGQHTSSSDALHPVTADDFARLFAGSHYAKDVERTIDELSQPPTEELDVPDYIKEIGSKPTLQAPRHQLRALLRRQGHWLFSVRRAVLAELIENLVFGLLLGSVFWQLPDTAGGAQSRGGIVFLALLFVALNALASLPSKFDQKIVFYKQRQAGFFAAWAYLFSQAVFDLLLELTKAACLMVPLYLMSGLNLGASGQRLLFAILIAALASLTMIAMTRFFVAVFNNSNAAQGVSGLITILLVLFAGYMKNPAVLDDWLVWLYWINPLHYAFEALMINEFEGLTFNCTPEELVPAVDAVPLDLRFCSVSTGEEYLQRTFGISEAEIYRLYFFLIVVGYNAFFFILSAIATATARPKGYAYVPPRPAEDTESIRAKNQAVVDVSDTDGSTQVSPVHFTFRNMTYSVENGSKILLDNVTGRALGGKVILLMGESGAGKTTLLDVLAMRKTLKGGASVDGEVRFNGTELDDKALAGVSGYCEQNDLHIGETTVAEAVMFSAVLRLPQSLTKQEMRERAEETMFRLGLQPFSQKLVKTLGAGEKKLLTMALEVVAEPRVLFLDEPTSGISSSSAMTVARVMKNIAASGTSVICTIHQPSKELFTMFDELLLLKRGGKTVYFGGIGENGSEIRGYFESRGAEPMNEDSNPADWMLDVIDENTKDWAQEWLDSVEKKSVDEETSRLAAESVGHEDSVLGAHGDDSGTSFVTEARIVIKRQFRRYWRLFEYNGTRVILNLALAVIIGLLYLRDIDNTPSGAQLAFAVLFLTLIPATLIAQNVVDPTVSGRTVFYREVASGFYRPLAHHIAVGTVELPFTIVATTAFSVIFYFLVGLASSQFGYFFLASQVLYMFAVMFGIMMATVIGSENLARALLSALFSLLNVLSGFFIRKSEMPSWWRWSTWVNPFSYYLSGVIQNEMSGREFVCTPAELGAFQLPDGFESCAAIPGGDFADTVLENGSQACSFCPIPNGQFLIEAYKADEVNKWVALVAIAAAIVMCRIVTGFGVAKLRFLTR